MPYGEGTILCEVPESRLKVVLEPKRMTEIEEPAEELARALEAPTASPPLRELVEGSRSPCIIVSDSTRPTPSRLIVEGILTVLRNEGIGEESTKIVVATGLHRPPTRAELQERLGEEATRRLRVVSHDAQDDENLTYLGSTSADTPLWVNSIVHGCDLIIADGYIEPHFFAGYTGGGKNILPGVSGLETIKANHGAAMIDHPKARAGVLEGNPIYQDIVEGARMTGLDFSVNVTLNAEKRVSGVFAGDFEEAHREGCRFLERHVKVEAESSDIVVSTNGGYPLDRDLYQAVKGMSVAEDVVREGGVIIIAAECRDGVGHPNFRRLMEESEGPEEILERIRSPGFFVADQWEAQILARILQRAGVICVTDGVEGGIIRAMHMTPAGSLEEALEEAYGIVGRDPEVTVIPGGPSTTPVSSGE